MQAQLATIRILHIANKCEAGLYFSLSIAPSCEAHKWRSACFWLFVMNKMVPLMPFGGMLHTFEPTKIATSLYFISLAHDPLSYSLFLFLEWKRCILASAMPTSASQIKFQNALRVLVRHLGLNSDFFSLFTKKKAKHAVFSFYEPWEMASCVYEEGMRSDVSGLPHSSSESAQVSAHVADCCSACQIRNWTCASYSNTISWSG